MLNTKQSKKTSRWSAFGLLILLTLPRLASAGTGFQETHSQSGLGSQDLTGIAGGIVNGLIGLIGIIFLLLVVYAGFLWMTGGGNTKQIDRAKKILVGAVIGLLLVTSAYVVTDYLLAIVR